MEQIDETLRDVLIPQSTLFSSDGLI